MMTVVVAASVLSDASTVAGLCALFHARVPSSMRLTCSRTKHWICSVVFGVWFFDTGYVGCVGCVGLVLCVRMFAR